MITKREDSDHFPMDAGSRFKWRIRGESDRKLGPGIRNNGKKSCWSDRQAEEQEMETRKRWTGRGGEPRTGEAENRIRISREQFWASTILVATVAFLSYWPSLENGLVFDDRAAIINNQDIRAQKSPLQRLFINDYWGTAIQKSESHKSWRPLTVLSFRWNFSVHSLRPLGYHLVNNCLHALVSSLLFKFCLNFTNYGEALLTAILFAVHPIHTEAVASVVGRAELLAATFYLTALTYYFGSRRHTEGTWIRDSLVVVLVSFGGTLCKETAITGIIVCIEYDVLLRYRIFGARTIDGKLLRNLLRRALLLVFGFSTIAYLRYKVMGGLLPQFSGYDNPGQLLGAPYRQLTYAYLWAFNGWLLVFPNDLVCDWTSISIPLLTSFADPRTLSILILVALLSALLLKGNSVVQMGICLLVTPFIPASHLLFPVGFFVAERVLYLPSLGFCLIIASGTTRLAAHFRGQRSLWVLLQISLALFLGVHVMKTMRRTSEWKDEMTLYSTGLSINKNNVKLLNNVGRLHEEKQEYQEALAYYSRAAQIHPEDVRGHFNLGNLYVKLNRLEEAEHEYRLAIEVLPTQGRGQRQGNGRAEEGKPRPARGWTQSKLDVAGKVTRLTLVHLQALLRLASLIGRNESRADEADKLFADVLQIKPDLLGSAPGYDNSNPDILYNLGIAAKYNGNVREALALFDRALALESDHEAALIASAKIIKDEGLTHLISVAVQRLRRVVSLGSRDPLIYFDLAMLSIRMARNNEAETYFKAAIGGKSNFTEALFNLALLYCRESRHFEALPLLEQISQSHGKSQVLLEALQNPSKNGGNESTPGQGDSQSNSEFKSDDFSVL